MAHSLYMIIRCYWTVYDVNLNSSSKKMCVLLTFTGIQPKNSVNLNSINSINVWCFLKVCHNGFEILMMFYKCKQYACI